jgi:hypothetical protein
MQEMAVHNPQDSMVSTLLSIDGVVVVFAVVVGIIAILLVSNMNRQFGGRIRGALWLFLCGVAVNMLAMLYTLFLGHVFMFPDGVSFDVHNAFMAVGMLFFIISTYRFSLLIPRS